jgi:FemAB-related protein (PEP-CTERM system-associated)
MVPWYLYAVRGEDDIGGVLPLFEVRGLLSGHVLISVPYGVYGGLCSADPETRAVLLEAARNLALRRHAKHVELRHSFEPVPDLPAKTVYVTFVKSIEADPESNFGAIPRNQRRSIRVAIKNGLEARRGWDALQEFYEVFVESRHRLGSPPFPLSLFEAIRDTFGKESQLLTVWHGERMLSGVISLFYRDEVLPYYGAALEEGFRIGVNDFMYWELMRESGLNGYTTFDFGRSREGSGPYNFKRHWGFKPKPLSYQYVLCNHRAIPNFSPSNPRLRVFIEAWKRLPLPVTRWLGPTLTRRLPLD